MKTLLQLKTNPLADAIALTGFLRCWLRAPDLATLDQMETGFITLPTIIEALPDDR